jgi:photosystem II reaction center protein PsbM|uniref:Photosystem II reaction center protein M n=36 Tax=Picea TaxID=3328 RepID=A0A8K1W829_9CONI|nr:photosystem II protein M [Picea brachytyla var. complanata]
MDLERFIHLYEIKSRAIFERSKDQEIMEVNTLAFIAVLLFLAISTAFLFIPYVKTASASSGNN